MESVSETVYGKIGESAKKSDKNDSGLQGFELRGTVDKVWVNNAGEKENIIIFSYPRPVAPNTFKHKGV